MQMIRPDPTIQPYMEHGVRGPLSCGDGDLTPGQVYFKSWTGTTIGFPPAEGGGGPGWSLVAGYHGMPTDTDGHDIGTTTGVIARNFNLDDVTYPIQLYQTNSGHAYVDVPDSGVPLKKLMSAP